MVLNTHRCSLLGIWLENTKLLGFILSGRVCCNQRTIQSGTQKCIASLTPEAYRYFSTCGIYTTDSNSVVRGLVFWKSLSNLIIARHGTPDKNHIMEFREKVSHILWAKEEMLPLEKQWPGGIAWDVHVPNKRRMWTC